VYPKTITQLIATQFDKYIMVYTHAVEMAAGDWVKDLNAK
jgi:hypothetical protein